MFRLEVARGIEFLEGSRRGRFPFGNMLLLGGRDERVLVDTGGGREVLTEVFGDPHLTIDVVLNTHYHVDHVSGNGMAREAFPEAEFWCPAGEAEALSSWDGFLRFTGFDRPGLDAARLFRARLGWTAVPVARELGDNDTLDLGGLEAVALRLPGHTPGHTGLWFPAAGIIFAADIDLSSFGPWYGDVWADIDAYLASVERVRELIEEASGGGRLPVTILTSHRRPLSRDAFLDRLPAFVGRVAERDERILALLGEAGPLTAEELAARWPIYGPQISPLPGILKSELYMVGHHLERLARAGKVASVAAGPSDPPSALTLTGGGTRWRVR